MCSIWKTLTYYTTLDMIKLHFTIEKTKGYARTGHFSLNGVTVQTPAFMPVGTKATIKWLPLEYLHDHANLGAENRINLILANTFHLYLRPGDQIIKKLWWLHRFENWDWLILTDSWWFQVFSLWLSKTGKPLAKVRDDGVLFSSPIDGSKHLFTPTWVVDIQMNLWSDIMMVLDVCSPTTNNTKDKTYQQMQLTHRWAKEQFDYFEQHYNSARWVLFPIIQWWLYPDLREESAAFLKQYAWDGIAIGWLSVGETREEMTTMLDWLADKYPVDKPRYLMWVWTPEDLIIWIDRGIDLFDCVHPTRLGRHGVGMKLWWNIKITNAQYREDPNPIVEWCTCHTCRNFTRAYLHHLHREWELLWGLLLSLHNIAYLHQICEMKRNEILRG